MAFKKATKEAQKLRAAIYAPSGGGKTMTALRIAMGIIRAMTKANPELAKNIERERVAVIDSEHGSASKYADKFPFDSDELTEKAIEDYISKIQEAGRTGYEVLIIDSLSHAWLELVQEVDALAASSTYKGSKFNAWSKGTPKQNDLIEAILNYPGHVIVTMRAKTEWAQSAGERKSYERIGLQPVQGKGIEYEFDVLIALNADHQAVIEKDRSDKFQGKRIEKPGEDFGQELAEWLMKGEPVKSLAEKLTDALGEHEAAANAFLIKCGWICDGQTFRDLAPDKAKSILNRTADFISKIQA